MGRWKNQTSIRFGVPTRGDRIDLYLYFYVSPLGSDVNILLVILLRPLIFSLSLAEAEALWRL